MPAPSLFTLSLCSVAAIALACSPRGKLEEARDYVVAQGRQGIYEFKWSVASLPTEVSAAGDYLVSTWHSASTRAAYESQALKRQLDAEIGNRPQQLAKQ